MTLPPFGPSPFVTVTVASLHAVTVVDVSGEIDLATSNAMADPLFAQLKATPPALILDLTKVGFMGSAGFAVLIEAHKRAQHGGTTWGILVPHDSPLLRVLAVTGLDQLLPIYSTMVSALREVGLHKGTATGSSHAPPLPPASAR
jgi:anti-anti-sigma factor